MNLLQNIFKDEKVLIQEIHDSFDNAQDELLKQAIFIIEQQIDKISDKAERLNKLGFVSSKIVLQNRTEKQILIGSANDADLVNYYKNAYPFLKFLKEYQLDSICKKYNLIYAPVSKYKEDVPEKNVIEIENAQELRDGDIVRRIRQISKISFYSGHTKEYQKFLTDLIKTIEFPDQLTEVGESDIRSIIINSNFIGNRGDSFYFNKATLKTIDKTGLFIAAPQSHFNLKGLKSKGLGFFNIKVTEVKDPIVFRYVKGGIQVLSKWGLEANDEMLQQPILN